MLIDTHAHLDFPDFSGETAALLERAAAAGVGRVITIGTTVAGSGRAVALAEGFRAIHAAVGIHPSNAAQAAPDFLREIQRLAANPRVVAIGEIGLDYHHLPSCNAAEGLASGAVARGDGVVLDRVEKQRQADVFVAQLELAAALGLNVVIHERDAWEDTLAILTPFTGRLRAVFHCFGKSLEQARLLLAMGHVVSFTGIVTFKNAQIVAETAAGLPPGSYMVETDCPYLAPVPHRGRRCEPAHVRLVAEKVAALRQLSLDEVARETTETAEHFFSFGRAA